MARAQDYRLWIGRYGNFTPVAEVARIHQEAFEKPRRLFQQFPRRTGTLAGDFRGISL